MTILRNILLSCALTAWCAVQADDSHHSAQHAKYDTERGFRHPGGLHTQEDFDRIRQQLANGNKKVTEAYNVLKQAEYAQPGVATYPVETIVRGGGSGENYINAARGATMAYQNALRWKIEDNEACAKAAVRILMAWANTTKSISGNSDQCLAKGIYGYEFAQAAELMRDYEGWSHDDFETFKRWMLDVWYPGIQSFLRYRNGTWPNSDKWWQAPGHYWSNWGLCNAMAAISIGILCDDVFIYNQGMSFIKYDQVGTWNEVPTLHNGGFCNNCIHNEGLTEYWGNLIVTTTDWDQETGAYGKVGQLNESGRDTGHAAMSLGLAVDIAHVAWNQGDDLFSYMDHRLAAGIEYLAAQCQSVEGLPWTNYHYGTNGYYYSDSRAWLMTGPALGAQMRAYWGTVIGHYEGVKGVKMPFSEKCYAQMGIDDGGTGSTSGDYDHLGYSVLMNTYDVGNVGNFPLNQSPPTELTGSVTYNGKTYQQTDLGALKHNYNNTAYSSRGLKAGTIVTLSPTVADGSQDTGQWLWDSGETTREITIAANESHIYRATYTNAQGIKSQQCFSIYVLGDCNETKMTANITVGEESVTRTFTTETEKVISSLVAPGSKVVLSLYDNAGYSNVKWSNSKTTNEITLASVKTSQTLTCTIQNMSGREQKVTFRLNVFEKEEKDRLVENGNYRIRHVDSGAYLTNRGDSAVLATEANSQEPTTKSQLWYIEHNAAAAKYNLISLLDSMAIKSNGAMSNLKIRPHRICFAKDTDRCAFYGSKNTYWTVDLEGKLKFEATDVLDDFPFELEKIEETAIQVTGYGLRVTENNDTYDLVGRKLSSASDCKGYSGIYIKDQKKFLQK